MLHIAPSTVAHAGRGVFADSDFPLVGQWICFYEGYRVPVDRNLSPLEQDYLLLDRLVGYLKPRHSLGVGQIVNDVSSIDLSPFPYLSSQPEQVQFVLDRVLEYSGHILDCNVAHAGACDRNYYRRATPQPDAQGVIHEPFLVVKPIVKGEELFHFYGPEAWLSTLSWRAVKAQDLAMSRAIGLATAIFRHVFQELCRFDLLAGARTIPEIWKRQGAVSVLRARLACRFARAFADRLPVVDVVEVAKHLRHGLRVRAQLPTLPNEWLVEEAEAKQL